MGSFANDLDTRRIRVFSYRTPGGRPACTIAIHTADGTSVDLEGPGNHSIRNKEIAGRVAFFLVSMRDPDQAASAGWDTFPTTRYLYDREIDKLRLHADLYHVDVRLRQVLPVKSEEEGEE